MVFSMDGVANMNWSQGAFIRDFDIGDSNLGFYTSYAREPGPNTDAPYAVNYPAFQKWTVLITLPSTGAKFELANAADVDQTIAGVEYVRHSHIDGGAVTMVASQRAVTPEFPASEATSAALALRKLVGCRRVRSRQAGGSGRQIRGFRLGPRRLLETLRAFARQGHTAFSRREITPRRSSP